jgi:hypothetical protein
MTKENKIHLTDEEGFAQGWLPPYSNDKEFLKSRIDFFQNNNKNAIKYLTHTYSDFIESFERSLSSHSFIKINGLEKFRQKDVITGCQHFIDQLIMTHGIDKLQVFDGGYNYYRRLNPKIKYVTIDTMQSRRPMILEHPFPRNGDKHPQYEEIISKANELGTDVYLDCAWLPIAWDINLDLNEPCIKGLCMSLSKPFGLHWSRIGVRWMKEDCYDTIAIENEFRMVSYPNVMIGMYHLDRFPMDHLVKKYRSAYLELCRQHDLTPAKTIMSAYSKKNKKMVGVANLLLNKINETD